jgi:cysteine desulfurase
VLNTCARLETLGYDVTYLPVDTYGPIDYDQLKSAIRPETCLISLMYGNNEVGTLQPIVQAGELAREHGIIMHVDAVQALGKLLINLTELPIDLASFSAHKLNGPKGVGALYISAQRQLIPQQFGGSQERKRRAGTENVAGIVGFSKAVQMAINHMDEISNHLKKLGLLFIQELEQQIGTESFFHNGHLEEKLPHIYNVSFPAIDTETMLMNLDLAGIAASSGSACASGSLELSHVLRAMRLPMDRMNSVLLPIC